MQVVWDHDSVTVRDVYEARRERRRIAYTTVLTMMQVLERKGHLAVSRDQRAHVYRPTSTRQRALRDMVRDFVDRVFGGAAEPLVQHLIRDKRLTEADVRAIARQLQQPEGPEGNDDA